jgi:hypothetical protein
VTVVPGNYGRLWIGDLFDESGAEAHRLVTVIATFWTALAGDLEFLIGIRHCSPLWIVPFASTRCSTIGTDFIVVFVIVRGRRPRGRRPSFTGRCVWILVLGKSRFEFLNPLALIKRLLELFNSLFKPEKPGE